MSHVIHLKLNENLFSIDFSVEELTCLATWKDGNSRYLVGLVTHHHAISNEERYRCFVYEKTSQSGKYRIQLKQNNKFKNFNEKNMVNISSSFCFFYISFRLHA